MTAASVVEHFVHNVDINKLQRFTEPTHQSEILTSNASECNATALNAKRLIGDALRHRIEAIDNDACQPGDEDTFFVADLGEVYRQHLRWKQQLPRVKPFFGTSGNVSVRRLAVDWLTNRSGQVKPRPQGAPLAGWAWHRLRLRLQDGD